MTELQLFEALGYSIENGSVKSAVIKDETLVISSEGFTIVTLPGAKIPSDMTEYTYSLDMIPKEFNGSNYCGLIYGHAGAATYTGRAQMKVKNNSHEFWCTGAPAGTMATADTLKDKTFGVDIATNLKISVNGTDMKYYINDVEIATSEKGGVSGNLALLVTAGSTMAFDNISVTNDKTSEVVYTEDFSNRVVESVNDTESVKLLSDLGFSTVSGGVAKASVKNGALSVTASSLSATTFVSLPSAMIPSDINDFSYEAEITVLAGDNALPNGLFFGYASVGGTQYYMSYTVNSGAYTEGTHNGELSRILYGQSEILGTLGDPAGAYASVSAAAESTLKLKVVQQNNTTEYYVNDIISEKAQRQNESVASQSIGLVLSRGCTVRVDNIVVSFLGEKTVPVYMQNFDNAEQLNEKGQTPETLEPIGTIKAPDTDATTVPDTNDIVTTVTETVTSEEITLKVPETSVTTKDNAKSGCKKTGAVVIAAQLAAALCAAVVLTIRKKV